MPKRFGGQLAKAAAGSSGLRFANIALSLVVSVLLTRILGVEGYGTYAYSISWILSLNIIATLGCQGLVVREVAANNAKQEWGAVRGILQWSNTIVLISSILISVVFALSALTFKESANPETLRTLWIASILVPITALTFLRRSAMQGFRHVVQGQLAESLLQPALFIAFLLAVYFLKVGELSAPWVMALKVLSSFCAFAVGAWLLYRVVPKSVRQAKPEYETKKWVPSMLSMVFMAGAGTILTRLDVIMLGMITGPAAVGLYAVALRISKFILMSQQIGAAVLAPHVAGLYAEGDTTRLQSLTTKSVRIIMAYAIPVTLAFIFLSYWILSIFGEDFVQARSVLTILCIGKLLNASTGSVGLLLNMTNNERDNAVIVGVGTVLNGVLNMLMIPRWGVEGAAIATTITTVFINVSLTTIVYKRLGIHSTILGKVSLFST